MSDDRDTDPPYVVGYRKPPKHTQWQKGQSGNPSGKKKKEESLLEKLEKLAAKEVVVQQNGVPVTMTQGEAMLAAAYLNAMKGEFRSFKFLFEQLTADARQSETKAPALTEDLLQVLETYADWVGFVESARSEFAATTNGEEDEGGDDDAF